MEPETNHTIKSVGSTVPVQSIKSCVVYDAASGQIHHHHSVLTLTGGKEPTEEEIARDALHAIGKRLQPQGLKLHVLHVAHGALEQGKRYRVDHAKQKLLLKG